MKQNNLEGKVLNTIKTNALIQQNDKIVVAVSGGPDSICMLQVLYKICQMSPSQMTICVAHVNHMMREQAKDDEEFVREFCAKKNIDFYSKSIDISKMAHTNKIGTEEAGRIARYAFFDEIMEKTGSNKVAIAHNKNDKVETMIMNIFRGSGLSGLKGIEVKRGKYIRPLLDCERAEIEEYCETENLQPRIDKTNFENIYTRNKIRNTVIPYVEQEFNPNFMETMNRLAELVKEQDNYIESLVAEKYKNMLVEEMQEQNLQNDPVPNCKNCKIVLDLKKFNQEENVIKSRMILYTITRLFGNSNNIGKIHIEDLVKLCSNQIGNKYLTPNKYLKVLVKNHKIYFLRQL